MSRRWVIKRYKEDPVYVSQNVGEQALAAWKAGMVVISLPGNISVSSASISAVEETLREDDSLKQLTAGADMRPKVRLTTEGDVVTNWYKANVGVQGWEKHYAPLPNYYKLVQENTVFVAARLPEFDGLYERGAEWVQCDEEESKYLDRIRIAYNHG